MKKYEFYSRFLMQEWNKILNSLHNSQPEVAEVKFGIL